MAASMPGFGPSETKEYLWQAELKKDKKTVRWDGHPDGQLEQIVLKLAVLGPNAVKDERNIVEVVSFNREQDKVKTCICSLTMGAKENQTLSDLSLFPPVNFTLIQGSGPLHITANHIVLEEEEDDGLSDDEDDESDEVDEENFADLREKLLNRVANGKGDAKLGKRKASEGDGDDDDDYDDEDEMEDEDEDLEIIEVKTTNKRNSGKGKKKKEVAKVEDEEDAEDDEEEEVEAPAKKLKLGNGKAESKTKASDKKKPKTPVKKENGDEPKTPKSQKTPVKKENGEEPKTPKNQKTPDAKTPKSEKKTPGKVYTSMEEIKAAIDKYPGGKPRKEDKFCNWVKNTYKISDTTWIGELWKWHKKAIGL